jgi:hypothetical protein
MGNPATLPYGRGSDWGFLLVHFQVVHPSQQFPCYSGPKEDHAQFRTRVV